MAITSFDVTCEKKKLKKYEPKSPYLTGDRVQLLSRVTEKRLVKKKTLDYVSSFPLAANIYKANSDEFKLLKRTGKKTKKSVLTLPNQPVPTPQICTASDMNDSEYYSQSNSNPNKPRIKKRSGIKNVRKPRIRNKEFEYYDREERFCSQFNVNLDSSSTDFMKNYKGDGRRGNRILQKESKSSCLPNKNEMKPHDVWAVLRSLNRFPFHPSPPMSEESIIGTKKKKAQNKRVNSKDTRVYETKEFAYISSYEVDNNSHSISQSTSYDRVTVIDKQDEFSKICEQFEDRFLKTRILKDSKANENRIDVKNKPKKRFTKKSNIKAIGPVMAKENNMECVPLRQNDLDLRSQKDEEYDKNNCSSIDGEVNSSLTNVDNTSSRNKVDYALVPTKESFVHSDNSGSSKAELSVSDSNRSKVTDRSTCRRAPPLKGISKINFNKSIEPANQMLIRRPEIQKRKPRLVTTMPSACIMPKLTQADIKKRLAAIRFPVIILGRDQVNSSVEIHDYNPPQFSGLDEHIWPFMVKWQDNKRFESERLMAKQDNEEPDFTRQINNKNDIYNPVLNSNKTTTSNNEVFSNKYSNPKSKYLYNNLSTSKDKTEFKQPAPYTEANSKRQSNNQKSITQLKDKMLNFLFQKIPNGNVVTEKCNSSPINPPINKVPTGHFVQTAILKDSKKLDAYTETCNETQMKSTVKSKAVSPRKLTKRRNSPVKSPQIKLQQTGFEYPWAKVKRVNDFIETVIKRIKTGVYYSQERKSSTRALKYTCATDIAMQTDHNTLTNTNISPKVTVVKKQTRNFIPGFDSSLPGLEIETLNMSQIAVKHCVTNIRMQFDVTVPTDTIGVGLNTKTLPLMPVEITESHTKVFKCKTTIVNAMLPAELCSILPKLMKLIDSDIKSLRPSFCAGFNNKSQSHLSPISEMAIRTTDDTAAIVATKALKSSISPLDNLSPAVKMYINGKFFKHRTLKGTTKFHGIKYNCALLTETMTKLTTIDILTYRIRLLNFDEKKLNLANQSNTEFTVGVQKQSSACTALELYTTKNKRLIPAFKTYDFEAAFRDILTKVQASKLNLETNIPTIQCGVLYVDILPYNHQGLQINMAVNADKINVSSVVSRDESNKYLPAQRVSHEKCIEYIKRSTKHGNKVKDQKSVMEFKINNRNKRKGFYRLYRKCKSATTIPTVEKCKTPLNKIQNLDDFFQILGSKKILASVFDGKTGNNILSSVIQMRNWITDINPKQALLILLLTNKKDTPNLVRFRPILLQGIAVNRITRATELDMEIEVIERENFNKFREYEGISYLPESVENHDRLLEELYWIAKTTASDYQKPFDESSETLLKSLLEKRKKLNPSYLRVMARYVGLGLLKEPVKK